MRDTAEIRAEPARGRYSPCIDVIEATIGRCRVLSQYEEGKNFAAWAMEPAMEPAIGALQFVWIGGHRRTLPWRDDYFIELVEHLTAVTPDIDRRVARVIRSYRRHTRSRDHDRDDPSGSSST